MMRRSRPMVGVAALAGALFGAAPSWALDQPSDIPSSAPGVTAPDTVDLAIPGTTCEFRFNYSEPGDPSGQDIAIFDVTGGGTNVAGLPLIVNGGVLSGAPASVIDKAFIESYCAGATGISNVDASSIVTDGLDTSNIAGDTYYGISFVGTDTSEGVEYTYELAFSDPLGTGGTTTLINTRTPTAPPDTDPPVVQSITLSGSPSSAATSVTYTVTFDENANNITTDDFSLTTTGATTANIASVSASSGTSVDVTVDTIDGAGSLRLDLDAATDIVDDSANAGPAAFSSGDVHTVAFPTITLSVDTSTMDETGSVSVTATASVAVGEAVTVPLSYSGTATNATDYSAPTQIVIASGATSQSVTLSAVDDTVFEGDEAIVIDMGTPSGNNATEDGVQQVSITLTDDETQPSLSIDDPSVAEGDSGTVAATFTVTLSGDSAQTVTVDYATSDVTATAGSDYTAIAATTLTFSPGETSKTFDVTVAGDEAVEADETLTVTLSAAGNATISDATGTGTITNDDAAAVTVADVSVAEDAGTATLTLTLDAAVDGGVDVDLSTSDGTALTADGDYTAMTNQTVTFAGTAGETQTVDVTLGADTRVELDETVTVSLSTLLPATVDAGDIDITDGATVTITNDDAATLTIADVSGGEDDGAITMTVSLDAAVDGGLDVDVSTADGTATIADSDYTAVTGQTLTFAGTAGETETFTVTPTADAVAEPDETVAVSLSNLVSATVDAGDVDASDGATVTLLNDDSLSLTLDDPSVAEGDAGSATLTFTVSLSGPAPAGGGTVDYASSDGTAGAGDDYTAASGTLSFAAGETAQTVDIAVAGDATVETDETMTLTLSNATGTSVVISDATGTGTITNDDSATISIADASASEADGQIQLEMTLSNPVDVSVSVEVDTADGTALAGVDYAAQSGLVQTFSAGTTSRLVTVPYVADLLDEPDETFAVSLSGLQASGRYVAFADASATATIEDDDATPGLSVADIQVAEDGGNAVLTVNLDAVSGQEVTFTWSTQDGTAAAPGDFTAQSAQPGSIPAGDTSVDLQVPIIDDGDEETAETFTVTLASVTNATGPAGPATVTIEASDVVAPTATISVPGGVQPQVFGATITFSEEVTGFALGDIDVTNGAASNLQTSDNTVFTVDITAASSGDVDIDIAAAVATDLIGIDNLAATTATASADAEAPVVTLTTAAGAVTGPFTLTISASEDITGLTLGDLSVANGTPAGLAGSGDSYTVEITPVIGQTVEVTLAAGAVEDLAGNPTSAASTFSVQAGSPEVAFDEDIDAIIDTVQLEARQRLDNTMAANAGMMDRSLDRFIRSQQGGPEARAMAFSSVPFDVSGTAEVGADLTLSTRGTFFGQTDMGDGRLRTAMGQFDVTRDEDDSWTAQISGRITHEWDHSATSRLGYFYGGSLSTGEISGDYEGESASVGVILGGYALNRVGESLYSDAYLGLGYAQTDLSFSDPDLALDGDYGAMSYYAGAGLTGSMVGASGVEFRPNVSLDYGKTEIGVVGFQAEAFGLTSTVSDDFGAVSVLEVSLTPEVIFPLGGLGERNLSVSPSLVCRHTTGREDEDECGAGLALSLDGQSADGRSRYGIGIDHQETGDTTRTSAAIYFERQF